MSCNITFHYKTIKKIQYSRPPHRVGYYRYMDNPKHGLLELIPALDGYVVYREGAEGIDECLGKTSIGEQGNVEVYSGTANLVSVGELTGSEVLRQVHHHVYLLAVEHVERLGLHDTISMQTARSAPLMLWFCEVVA